MIVVTHQVCYIHYKENFNGWYSQPARWYRISGRVVQLNRAVCHERPLFTKALKFIADGYSAYPLAAQQFKIEKDWDVFLTQVIGLTNDDEVSKEFRPFKQLIERLNRTFKESYRITCGYGTEDGAIHSVSLWVAYYNFLRPHEISGGKEPLNKVDLLEGTGNMPGKWQFLIYLGQQTILKQQSETSICS